MPWSSGPPGAFTQEGPDREPAWHLLRRPCVRSTHPHHCFPPTPRVTDEKIEAQGGQGFPSSPCKEAVKLKFKPRSG